MLARALEFEDRYDESEALLRQALAIHERVFGLVHPRVASVVNDLGNLAMRRGHAEEAEPSSRSTSQSDSPTRPSRFAPRRRGSRAKRSAGDRRPLRPVTQRGDRGVKSAPAPCRTDRS